MITEITIENKAKFFSLYFGQDVCEHPNVIVKGGGKRIDGDVLKNFNSIHLNKREWFTEVYLKLKPLSSITDEDIIHVASLAHERYKSEWKVIRNNNKIIHCESIGSLGETYHISMLYDYATVNANVHWPETKNEKFETFAISIGCVNMSSRNPIAYIAIVDYLRSKGYLIPWMGLSIEKLIKSGWAKFKQE